MKLPRFYPIFDRVAWLERLLPKGVRLVQIRIKDRHGDELKDEIRRARAVSIAHDCQLVVNDHWQEAIEEGCDFIHLGQEDLDSADMASIRRAGIRIGISTHDDAELERALRMQPSYIALGPIYPTKLKKMKWGPQGLSRVANWKQRVGGIPLVAIGGMSVARAGEAFAAGADVVAAVTDITESENPEQRVLEWLAAARE